MDIPPEVFPTAEDRIANCKQAVLGVFPDICVDFLDHICRENCTQENGYSNEAVIAKILDLSEGGQPYPKQPRANLKRKRMSSQDEPLSEERRFNNDERRGKMKHVIYMKHCLALLQQDFPMLRLDDLRSTFTTNGSCLYPTYMVLDKTLAAGKSEQLPFQLMKQPRRRVNEYKEGQLSEAIANCEEPNEREALEEFRAARAVRKAQQEKVEVEKRQEREDLENFEQAQIEGTAATCECCCDEFAMNRMVHCDGHTFHWFCRDCARRMAENEIGLSKHHLACMSMDGCEAGFSRDQRSLFLDNNLVIALERIEQEAVLRMAGIENLETCPFCPYAAEYPPIEVNKEFRCQHPICEVVSCRSCRQETHIPKTCEEAALENGHSARRIIEEAMSAAMIRKCNKCNTPFVKEAGCNKMTCTRGGCHNIQCYICSKSCDYAHFDDAARGGKKGNCPLFDSVEKRHEDEVRAAEEQARKRVAEENPDVQAELLEFKVSEQVKKDDEERKKRQAPRIPHDPINVGAIRQEFRGHFARIPNGRGLLAQMGNNAGDVLAQHYNAHDMALANVPLPAPAVVDQQPARPQANHQQQNQQQNQALRHAAFLDPFADFQLGAADNIFSNPQNPAIHAQYNLQPIGPQQHMQLEGMVQQGGQGLDFFERQFFLQGAESEVDHVARLFAARQARRDAEQQDRQTRRVAEQEARNKMRRTLDGREGELIRDMQRQDMSRAHPRPQLDIAGNHAIERLDPRVRAPLQDPARLPAMSPYALPVPLLRRKGGVPEKPAVAPPPRPATPPAARRGTPAAPVLIVDEDDDEVDEDEVDIDGFFDFPDGYIDDPDGYIADLQIMDAHGAGLY